MKINFIMPGLGDSGGIKVIRKYASMMKDNGQDVIIYCSIKAENLHRYTSNFKNKIHQIYCTFKIILTILKNEKPEVKWVWSINNKNIRDADVSIATMWATAYEVVKLSPSKGKKWYFVQGLEIWDNLDLGLKSYMLPLKKIVISSWINDSLKNRLNIGPYPIVMNGIDTEKFKNNKKNKEEHIITFLMLNHTMKKKGVKQGIEVFEKVRNRHSNVKLKMFGMCSKDNLPDYVEYIQNPSIEELVDLYNTVDIFIFPSLEEGWGLTPIEAMACGCAVVGTRTGFVLDFGKHLENMMISEPGDIDGMVDNIMILMENKELRLKVAAAGNQTVERLDWKNSANIFIKYLLRG